MAIKYRIVLDTETCPCDNTLTDVSPDNMFVYDFGWCVTDRHGNIYKTRSFIVNEIFFGEEDLMQSAYYAEKIPKYLDEIASGERIVANWYDIRQTLLEDMEEFGVKELFAHNMRFDYGSVNNTERWITKSRYRYFFPKNVKICDTLKMSRQLLKKSKKYKKFCLDNGYMTKNNQCRYTAEVLYRFITGDLSFIESHTGLEDVLIEKEILRYLFSKHKRFNALLWN